MLRRPSLALGLAVCLLTVAIVHPVAAFGQSAPTSASGSTPVGGPADILPEPMPPQPTPLDTWLNTDSMAYGTGALIGIIAFNVYLVPIATAAGTASLQSWLGTRVVATTLAATGGVLTAYAYDLWADRPVNTTYFLSRAGAIAGVAVGSTALAVLGFPPATALVQYSGQWFANRGFLVASGLFGETATYYWLRAGQTNAAP